MKLDLSGSFGTLANVGVILGILLLVYELAQNRQTMEAQTRNEIAQGVIAQLYQLAQDDETADLMLRGFAGDQLTAAETYRFETMLVALFRLYENVHYQYRSGLYDEEEFNAQRRTWQDAVFAREGIVNVWCSLSWRFSPAFAEEVNALLTVYKCE